MPAGILKTKNSMAAADGNRGSKGQNLDMAFAMLDGVYGCMDPANDAHTIPAVMWATAV